MPRVKANPHRRRSHHIEQEENDESVLDDDEVRRLEEELEFLRREKAEQIRRIKENRRRRGSPPSSSDSENDHVSRRPSSSTMEPRGSTRSLMNGIDRAQQRFKFNVRRIEEKFAERERAGLLESHVEMDNRGVFFFPDRMAPVQQQNFVNRMYQKDAQFGKGMVSAPRNSIDTFDGDVRAMKKAQRLDERFGKKMKRSESDFNERSRNPSSLTEKTLNSWSSESVYDDDVFENRPSTSTMASYFDRVESSEDREFADDEEEDDEEEDEDYDEDVTPLASRSATPVQKPLEPKPEILTPSEISENRRRSEKIKLELVEPAPKQEPITISRRPERIENTPNLRKNRKITEFLRPKEETSSRRSIKREESKVKSSEKKTPTSSKRAPEEAIDRTSSEQPTSSKRSACRASEDLSDATPYEKKTPTSSESKQLTSSEQATSSKRSARRASEDPVEATSSEKKTPTSSKSNKLTSSEQTTSSKRSQRLQEDPSEATLSEKKNPTSSESKEATSSKRSARRASEDLSDATPSEKKTPTSSKPNKLTSSEQATSSKRSQRLQEDPSEATSSEKKTSTFSESMELTSSRIFPRLAPKDTSKVTPSEKTPTSSSSKPSAPEEPTSSDPKPARKRKPTEKMVEHQHQKTCHDHQNSTKKKEPYCRHCEIQKEEKKKKKKKDSEDVPKVEDVEQKKEASKNQKKPRRGSGTKRRSATVGVEEPELKKKKLTDSDLISIPSSLAVIVDTELIASENNLNPSTLPKFSDSLTSSSIWSSSVDSQLLSEMTTSSRKATCLFGVPLESVEHNSTMINVWVDNLHQAPRDKDTFSTDFRRAVAQSKKARMDGKAGYDIGRRST